MHGSVHDTARNVAWNGYLSPGSRISTGFTGSWAASNAPPTRFTLNGNLCETGTP